MAVCSKFPQHAAPLMARRRPTSSPAPPGEGAPPGDTADQSERRPRTEDFLAGGGEMGERIRALDWSKTAVGPVATWPQSLKIIVRILLTSRYAMWLGWGPDLTFFCNDAYRPTLGIKHVWALGASAREVWREIWPDIGPRAEAVMRTGVATWDEGLLLFLERSGYAEETYHTFSYSPVPDDRGGIGGMLCVVTEDTERTIGERRLSLLRELASGLATTHTEEEVFAALERQVSAEPRDLPFALTYLFEADGKRARLASAIGVAAGTEAAPRSLDLAASDAPWPAARIFARGAAVTIAALAARFAALPTGPWDKPARQAVAIPIAQQGQARPAGFLVAGINPYRPLDAAYRGFLDLLAGQIASGLANARAHEEERRRAAALAELDRAKTAFFSNVSHEFRTPLTLILGPTEDAVASPARTLAGADLESVHRNALRLLKLVNSLLDFSRIEAGRAQASYEPTDLAALTTDLASAFRSAIERAGIAFEVDCPPLSAPVFVDHDMWEKIVLNLLSNALKFTFEGSIRVALAEREGCVEVTVRDTGVGVPEDELPRLFERFHRVKGARARTHEGTGIGLALVHELVRLHGGTIRAASKLGDGTTFTITLPRGAEHLPADRIGARRALASTATGAAPYVEEALRWLPGAGPGVDEKRLAATVLTEPELGAIDADPKKRILVADDNADMRDYVRRLLSERWTVEVVGDGAEALAAARRSPPDLVVTDVMMPRLDGFGLLRELRADPLTRRVPVLMLSARSGEESRVEGLSAGADDYLVKPFSARELVARVATHLQIAGLRRTAEQERERMYALFKQSHVGFVVLRGPEDVIELVNPRYEALVGGRALLGRRLRDAFPELADTQVLSIYERVRATGKPFAATEYRADIDRGRGVPEESYWSFDVHPVLDENGDVERIMLTTVDVTEHVRARKRLEEATKDREDLLHREQEARREAEAANRAKDEFLAMLGHELRNPLAPITTALYLMRLRHAGVAEKERGVIERQVEHLARLVDDLLDVSRVARGKIELKKQRVEVAEVVAKAIEMASPLLEQRRHHLALAVPTRGLAVDGDLTRLGQVVSNLLTNAAKYTKSDGRIAVSAERKDHEIVLRVRDNGIGIEPEMLPRVFDLFMQERQAIDRAQGGLGLGLAIVRSFVALHGGSVSAHSGGRERGSEFTIRLPAAAQQDGDGVAQQDAATPISTPAPASGGLRILVVDDNTDAASLLAESLSALGHTTRVAHDGPSGLQIAEQLRPDVALLDIGLPVMDGYELARRLRELPGLQGVTLIAVTGYGQNEDVRRSREAGFDAHLVKPVQTERLAPLLDELRRRRAT